MSQRTRKRGGKAIAYLLAMESWFVLPAIPPAPIVRVTPPARRFCTASRCQNASRCQSACYGSD